MSGPYGPKEALGIWVLPVLGGEMRKLLDNASVGAIVSPDDSRIAFRRGRGIWLVDVAGGRPRQIFTVPAGYHPLPYLTWSPDGRRIAFVMRGQAGDERGIEILDPNTGRAHTLLSDPKIESFCWPPDGRLIYSRREDPPNDNDSNLWDIGVDDQTAQAVGQPRRLTNWGGFLLKSLAVSRDGKRLFLIPHRWRSDVVLADLTGAHPAAPKRLTFEWLNRPTGWTADSRRVFFDSERNGALGAFQQDLDSRESQPLVTTPDDARGSRLSPDGRWILYLAWSKASEGIREEGRLMRMSAQGGPSEIVFPVSGPPIVRAPWYPTAEPYHPRFRCPSASQSPCVLSELIEGQVVFTYFDPAGGRKEQITTPALKEDVWDLSPDGRWIAVRKPRRLLLVSLAGQQPREIPIDDGLGLTAIAWAADGKSLLTVAEASAGERLMRVSLNGEVQVLYTGSTLRSPVVSPDGRYLAFADMKVDSDAWIIEDFR